MEMGFFFFLGSSMFQRKSIQWTHSIGDSMVEANNCKWKKRKKKKKKKKKITPLI